MMQFVGRRRIRNIAAIRDQGIGRFEEKDRLAVLRIRCRDRAHFTGVIGKIATDAIDPAHWKSRIGRKASAMHWQPGLWRYRNDKRVAVAGVGHCESVALGKRQSRAVEAFPRSTKARVAHSVRLPSARQQSTFDRGLVDHPVFALDHLRIAGRTLATLPPQAIKQATGQHRRADEDAEDHQQREQDQADQTEDRTQQRVSRLARRESGVQAGRIEMKCARKHGVMADRETIRLCAGSNSIVSTPGEDVRTSLIDASNRDREPVALAMVDAIENGGFHEVEASLEGDAESLILHRDGAAVRAWLNVCPHNGRRLDWAPGKFLKSKEGHLVCAVHGATFETAAGQCIAGPCRGDALGAVDVEVRDGQVWLSEQGSR